MSKISCSLALTISAVKKARNLFFITAMLATTGTAPIGADTDSIPINARDLIETLAKEDSIWCIAPNHVNSFIGRTLPKQRLAFAADFQAWSRNQSTSSQQKFDWIRRWCKDNGTASDDTFIEFALEYVLSISQRLDLSNRWLFSETKPISPRELPSINEHLMVKRDSLLTTNQRLINFMAQTTLPARISYGLAYAAIGKVGTTKRDSAWISRWWQAVTGEQKSKIFIKQAKVYGDIQTKAIYAK